MNMKFQSCLAIAPLRVSFVGGGTDFSDYYEKNNGAVVSTAISKYVYVHVKRHDPLFQERYRISYSEVEHVQNRNEIKNEIVKASLEFLNMDEPLQISTSSDLPAASGLGSSSSFTVALLLALHSIKGEKVSQLQLAEEACYVEIQLLKSPIGKQDQFAAAFGGVNFIEFLKNDRVRIEPLLSNGKDFKEFLNNSYLIWTKQTRNANEILINQRSHFDSNMNLLDELKQVTFQFKDVIQTDPANLLALGSLIKKSWEIKKQLSELIEIEAADEIIQFSENISHGYKLLGAGGGGFVFTLLKNASDIGLFADKGFRALPLEVDMRGATILSLSN
jgi:D-glycero-alpha-D-manno-heptose-7-phosphate kinase